MAVFVCFLSWSCGQQQIEESVLEEQPLQTKSDGGYQFYIGELEGLSSAYINQLMAQVWNEYPKMQEIIEALYGRLGEGISFKYNPNIDGVARYNTETKVIEIGYPGGFSYWMLMEELLHMYQHLIYYSSEELYSAHLNIEFEAKIYVELLEKRRAQEAGLSSYEGHIDKIVEQWIWTNDQNGKRKEIETDFDGMLKIWLNYNSDYQCDGLYNPDFKPSMLIRYLYEYNV